MQVANNFLGEEKKYIDEKVFSQIISETEIEKNKIEKEISENKNEKEVSYDKYKKAFKIKDENEVSMGEIISARRLGFEISLPEELEKFGDGKKIRKIMIEKKVNDFLFSNLNKNLAQNLSEKIRQQDLLKAKAYEKIAERSGEKSEQLGVVAEQIILQEAVSKWQKEGKSISGPWKFLSPEIRIVTLNNLFKDILSEEQIKSLIKNIK